MSERLLLKSRLTRTLVGLGLISVVSLAAVNFVVVRDLLDSTTREQLVVLRELRSDSVEVGVKRVVDRTSAIGSDPGLAAAMSDLDDGYRELEPPSDTDIEPLLGAYEDVVDTLREANALRQPEPEALLPASDQGRAAQVAYIADNSEPDRAALVDAGDGTEYSAAHAEHHEYLRGVAEVLGADDLLLVSAESNEVVYSVEKQIDLGTDVVAGPYREDALGVAWDRLENSGVTDAVITDASFYIPSLESQDAAAPVVHVGATVRQGTEVLGALVLVLGVESLTAIVTAGGQFELLGLGDTGDAYIVGGDGTLRPIPRSFSEDPEGYVERYLDTGGDERLAGLITFTGSPVLFHAIDNAAVDAALAGDEFVGIVDNGLDRRAVAASAPLDVQGVPWYLVTEQQTSETRDELQRFLWSTAILLVVLLPILAVLGFVLARVFARPVDPLVRAAGHIADGDFTTRVDDLGRNELGDLGRQLNSMAVQLQEHEASAAEEEARITAMLASVLPADLVDRVRAGERDVSELVDTATVIALTIVGIPEPEGAEQDAVIDMTQRLADELDGLREQHGIERIRAASDQQIFVAGRGMEGDDASSALDLAARAIGAVVDVGAEFGVALEAHAGLASGLVASGVLGRRQVSFGMWGEAVVRATELAEVTDSHGVFVDGSVVDSLADDVGLTPLDLGGAGAGAFQVDLASVPGGEPSTTGSGR